MKRIRGYFGFTITELILAVAISAILVLTMGVVMVDTQRGWMDSYAKVHGGAATDAVVAKTAFDKVIRKASRSLYHFNADDDITVYYYNNWLTSAKPDRSARFYRSTENLSEMYIQHSDIETNEVLTEILLATNVADLEFKPISGGLGMKLALDDGREVTTVITTALLHNE